MKPSSGVMRFVTSAPLGLNLADAFRGRSWNQERGFRFLPHPFTESHTHFPKTTPIMTHLMAGHTLQGNLW